LIAWLGRAQEDEWGARANSVLSTVRGKGFRHEKTKKKRGSYKGTPTRFPSRPLLFVLTLTLRPLPCAGGKINDGMVSSIKFDD
jgi:hypothetical protein